MMRVSVALIRSVTVHVENNDDEAEVEDAAIEAAVLDFKEYYGLDVNPRDLVVLEDYE